MNFLTLLLIAVGLSMDAFSVAICKGLALPRTTLRDCALVGVWFGGFQALMPIVGYFVGVSFSDAIRSVDHWVAFALLALIGVNMLREALGKEEEEECVECANNPLAARKMLPMAVATSIDALAVGVSFAFLGVDIWGAAATIGVTTFLFSAVGVKIGNIFGARYKSKAEVAGGIILILIGLKILLEHTVLA
ncbi:MAG: manganese efflux pump [Tidjanibacter sp.]|nr:manganese efflux pump [Tidjanibacter sp.]MBR3854287.1 manganese efflux pump [Tidjanibacter sp.]MBR4037238.1 manganese efflux pump [Tidjanibacter sp.]